MIPPSVSILEPAATVKLVELLLVGLSQQIRQAFIIPATVTEILK